MMSYIWTFSPESKALLQRCLSAAAPPDESNKWIRKFGPRNMDLLNKTSETIIVNDSPDTEDNPTVQENQHEDISNVVEEFLDPDVDMLSKFGYFVEVCTKSPKLLTKLAPTLPINTVEKLFQHVLNIDNLNTNFLQLFYEYFLPNYVKRDNSRFCTDILLQTYIKYPQYLKLSLKVLLKDVEIQNNVVNNFILNLNANDQSEVLKIVSDIEFTSIEFTHNLFTICTAYKSCNKTDFIQNYIFSCLKNHSDFCCTDKNYGKLMLAFLQHENSLKRDFNSDLIEELIERHKSPFKRPCLSVLREIKDMK